MRHPERKDRKKGPSPAQLRLYARLSSRGRFQGVPRDEDLWLRILEVTNGRGLRPDRRPVGQGGGFYGLVEFLDVPPLLRNYKDGLTLDDVAQMLGMESDTVLLRDLAAAARNRWANHYGRRKDEPIDFYDEDPGEPYHPGEEDEWPEGLAVPADADKVPF